MKGEKLASALGWLSIGLGIVEVAAPRRIVEFLGMEGRDGLVRGYGVREIANGIALMSQPRPAPWVWARVGGDLLDLATLGSAMSSENSHRNRVMATTAAVAAVTAVDVMCGRQLSREV